MFEKVNPSHPDKVADRIAGALVDMAYATESEPRIAVEVLIGHGVCHVIAETSVALDKEDVGSAVSRIAGNVMLDYKEVPQDPILAGSQEKGLRCGDNGIFRGVPVTDEQRMLSDAVRSAYGRIPYDGKYIVDGDWVVACQSNASNGQVLEAMGLESCGTVVVNPLGEWSGGMDVDCGATNRKLGSDMADSVTGGGLHGKDFSKADVSANIYAWLKAQRTGDVVEMRCAIGDESIDGIPYSEIVETARNYVMGELGGFERLAEWGLV